MPRINVKFFAIARDRAGVAETDLELDEGATVAAAGELIGERYPSLRDVLPRVAYAVNREYAPLTAVLREGDELAVIPPVSGG